MMARQLRPGLEVTCNVRGLLFPARIVDPRPAAGKVDVEPLKRNVSYRRIGLSQIKGLRTDAGRLF